MAQMKHVSPTRTYTPNQGATVGSRASQTGGPQIRAAAAAAKDALLDLAATNLGVAKASLTVTDGVVSGGGRTVTYGALLGDKLFNVTITARRAHDARRRALPGTKPISQYKMVGRARHPARRHPGQGERHVHVRPQRQGPRHAARPRRPAARPGRVRRRHRPEVLSIDESSIKNVPGAKVVRLQGLRRRRRADRVRRDPGRRPAEGDLGREPAAPGRRQPLEADAGPRRRRQDAGPRARLDRQLPGRVQHGADQAGADATSSTTTARCRSARAAPWRT